MCGIAGIVSTDGIHADALARMSESIAHRGPDDQGFMSWVGQGHPSISRDPAAAGGARVAFAHRRLSIIDLGPAGRQPMANVAGSAYVTYNGEIYNYLEIREELERAGFAFRTATDTEVLLAALDVWGNEGLGRLTGMFAFARLDVAERRVELIRDPFGIKPLYYTHLERGLAFASEIKALLVLPEVRRKIDPGRLYRYLRFGITDDGDGTLFSAIKQVPPGGILRVPIDRPGEAATTRYWEPRRREAELSFPEAVEAVQDAFLASVELHMRSDVPIGAALSGGIDSSAIVAAMRAVSGDRVDLRCFTFSAPGTQVDESRWAEMVVGEIGADGHVVAPGPTDLVRDLDKLIAVQDEPFGSLSIYAQFRVMQLAAENGVKVMLDGQGADELFAGYRPFLAARLADLIRRGHLAEAAAFIQGLSRMPDSPQRRVILQTLGGLLPAAFRPLGRRMVGEALTPGWLDAGWFRNRGVEPTIPFGADGRDTLHDRLSEALTTTVLPALLRYEDRNSMAFSIEARVPFLTTRLADLAFSLPDDYLIGRDGSTKRVLREALRGIVPDAVLDRKDKIGFVTPTADWLHHSSTPVDRILSSDAAKALPCFRHTALRRHWEDASRGRSRIDPNQIWRWMNVVSWSSEYGVDYD